MKFNYVTVIPNCIPKELISLLLQFKNNSKEFATVGRPGDLKTKKDYRNTEIINLPDKLTHNISNAITNFYNTQLIEIYKQSIKFVEPPQFLYYNIGGKYDVHNDAEYFINGKVTRVVDRDLTILIYLNDDYEGGELEFPDWGIIFKPKAGTLIAFPSYIDFSHRVLPVTKGERFNIASWICLNDRIYPRPYS